MEFNSIEYLLFYQQSLLSTLYYNKNTNGFGY